MANFEIPSEQWAQVVEQKSGRTHSPFSPLPSPSQTEAKTKANLD
jgi:hypothetical protein